MKIEYTDEVVLGPLAPSIALVTSTIAGLPLDFTVWVTALDNGKHMDGSKHDPSPETGHQVAAIDLDCTSTSENELLTDELKEALPPGYDVILEDIGTGNEHIHIEHDPV